MLNLAKATDYVRDVSLNNETLELVDVLIQANQIAGWRERSEQLIPDLAAFPGKVLSSCQDVIANERIGVTGFELIDWKSKPLVEEPLEIVKKTLLKSNDSIKRGCSPFKIVTNPAANIEESEVQAIHQSLSKIKPSGAECQVSKSNLGAVFQSARRHFTSQGPKIDRYCGIWPQYYRIGQDVQLGKEFRLRLRANKMRMAPQNAG